MSAPVRVVCSAQGSLVEDRGVLVAEGEVEVSSSSAREGEVGGVGGPYPVRGVFLAKNVRRLLPRR